MKRPLLLSSALLATLAGAGSVQAALSFSDPFTDNALVGGSDNSGISWYDRSVNTTLSIIDDSAGIGSGRAMRLGFNISTVNNRGVVGALAQAITLSAPGDTVTLSFSFRLYGTGTPLASSEGFTFGLYNSNGTPVNAVHTAQSDDDFGYRGDFGTGTTSRVAIFKETNLAASAGGLGTGSDGGSVTVVNPLPVAINDFLVHTASITLTYNSATDMGISLTYDGNVVGTGTSSVPFFTFDEVVFSQAGSNPFLIDNVLVTSNVPEAGTTALAALCGVLGMTVRRRR